MDQSGELWMFAVDSPDADGVFLVGSSETAPSTWQPMSRGPTGRWELRRRLEPGQYQFHYFTATGATYINCGTEGLSIRRLHGDDPGVHVSQIHDTDRQHAKLAS